jgi:hypothetical protein
MARFRKKPVEIDAFRFRPSASLPDCIVEKDGKYWIATLEGRMEVVPGAMVITGVSGEKYACDYSIFLKTYDAVDDESRKELL